VWRAAAKKTAVSRGEIARRVMSGFPRFQSARGDPVSRALGEGPEAPGPSPRPPPPSLFPVCSGGSQCANKPMTSGDGTSPA